MSLVLQKIARNLISEECFSSSERQLQMGDMGGSLGEGWPAPPSVWRRERTLCEAYKIASTTCWE